MTKRQLLGLVNPRGEDGKIKSAAQIAAELNALKKDGK